MGFISRKIFPACGSMCVCCPALRSRSRQPVKRYKKLLADVFPKSPDASLSERKIAKLCEYARKNPFRIPKIAKYLEERCYKELRYEHAKFVNIVAEVYNKLLCLCNEQMAYFAVSLVNAVAEMLDCSKQDAVLITGCQTLTKFIYSQVDGTYIHSIENLVLRVCDLARQTGEATLKRCLRASSLQCLAAMVWYMMEFSHIFVSFSEIVNVALDNYQPDMPPEQDDERGDAHHNWVDEIVRCEGRGGSSMGSESSGCMNIRSRPEKKDRSLLTREEIETPKVWAQICIQRMFELGKESTTMRLVLDHIFVYFDTRRHWIPRHGFAFIVLSDVCYNMESSGNQQLILSSLIRHLDHKNVSHDDTMKSQVVQVASSLSRQIRAGTMITDIGYASDLCRHLRKSLQSTVEAGGKDLNVNVTLQNSIEDCLLETARGIADPQPLFDLMAITLEKLPVVKVVARATIRSLMILANVISLASVSSRSQQVFPEALLVQLLKVMLHPDVEVRVGGHQIFSVLLIPTSNHPRHNRRWHSNTASMFASITALLEKLRREKDGSKIEYHRVNVQDDHTEHEHSGEEWKQGRALRSSPNFQKLSSIIDRTAGSANLHDTELSIMEFGEDQITQLLSAFWIQTTFADNLPPSIEAISHSFCLTLLSSRLTNPHENLVIRFFQLPISLVKVSLDVESGMLPPAYQRSLFVLATAMLMFAAKLYQIPDLIDLLKSIVEYDIDPYVAISNDFQVYVKHQADVRQYGSSSDKDTALSLLFELRKKFDEYEKVVVNILARTLSSRAELEECNLMKVLTEAFVPEDTLIFGLQSDNEFNNIRTPAYSKDSSSDGGFSANNLVEDDAISESSVSEYPHVSPRMPTSNSTSSVITIGQLLESALEVAGQVAGSSVSTSPLPYSAMTSQCEAFGMDTRKKLSSWLVHEDQCRNTINATAPIAKITREYGCPIKGSEPMLTLRLPPASPFDNFLKAARC